MSTATVSSLQRSTDRRFFGVVEAIVVDVNDPAKEERVKVQFPWFDDNFTSEWSRVRQFYAGNGYGAFWIPEPQDEVLVAFIHGDMRQPIVLGGLYNGQDKPPTSRDKTKNEKLIRTLKGHQILFDDSDGKEKIVIVDSKQKNRIEIDTEANSITVKSDGGKIILEADEIEMKATIVKVQASSDIEMNAKNVKVQASSQMNLDAATTNITGKPINLN